MSIARYRRAADRRSDGDSGARDGGRPRAWRALALATAAAWLAAGCGEDDMHPGRADVREGDPAEVRIETAAGDRTSPAELTVPAGTEVTWANRTTSTVFLRFDQPIDRTCAGPVRFHRTDDGRSFASDPVQPFGDARLCIATPGRYEFVVTFAGVRSGQAEQVRRGTIVVVP